MVCNEQASGFVKPDDILKTGQFTDFSILPSRGYSLLVRATIPFLRITDELIKETKEPELKEYIQERYRKPWLKRMSELPFD